MVDVNKIKNISQPNINLSWTNSDDIITDGIINANNLTDGAWLNISMFGIFIIILMTYIFMNKDTERYSIGNALMISSGVSAVGSAFFFASEWTTDLNMFYIYLVLFIIGFIISYFKKQRTGN